MQNRSQITHEKILETSFQLFLANGYESTGVARICEEADISKGAFYHHFPSKHDVFLTILDNWLADVEAQFKKIEDTSLPIPEQLNQMAASLKGIFSESNKIPIFREFWMQSIRDKSVSSRTLSPYFRFMRYFESLVQKGITEGSFAKETDAAQVARLLMSFGMGAILQSMIEPNKDWQTISESNLQVILAGIQKENV
ncbi:MAG: TetR/AcrR family transcriptional regulator [Anaerolineaceae bacterium]|nr:TetR/AcrR family transcriptional regulator [Anaerolineaceae bacterium]